MGQLTEEDVLAGLDSEWEESCEMSVHEHHGFGPAKWIMWFTPCCNDNTTGSPYILACDACKDYMLGYPCLRCPGCNTVFDPGSTAYSYIEALNKS